MQAGKPFHRNITIEQNTFHAFDYPVLYAKSTEGLIFSGNTIAHPAGLHLIIIARQQLPWNHA